MASASGYNYHRFTRAVLKKARKWEPSLSIQLYPTYWRFEHSEINFLYDGPMKPFLMALRAQVIPAALIPFLYDIRPPVAFVDGCLVVEIQDFRKVPEVRSRVVMRPAPETLPLTIDNMLSRRQERWDDNLTLELESRILAATSPPLYLGTSIMASRNAALSLALTAPAAPNVGADGQFRSNAAKGEEEDNELASIRKLLGAGTRSAAGAFQPNWSVLRLLERIKAHNKQKESEAAARAAGQAKQLPTGGPGGGPPPPTNEEKKKTKKKRPAAEAADDGEKKPAKKKKAAPKVAPAADKDKDKDKKDEEKKDPPKKEPPKKGAKKEAAPKKKAPPKKKAAAAAAEEKK